MTSLWPRSPGRGRSAYWDTTFFSPLPESPAGRGFCETILFKILLSKNLDIAILKTKSLAVDDRRWADRHSLGENDSAVLWKTGSMSQQIGRGLWKKTGAEALLKVARQFTGRQLART